MSDGPATSMDHNDGTTGAERMVCMEVWGGNSAVDTAVGMAGLDAWIFSRPFQAAVGGGDVHYVSSCATGRITRLLIADVSGHGDEVAELAKDLRTLMRRYVNFLDQKKFVKAMNAEFVESSAAGIFATAIVTTFFAPTRLLSLCNAGHPPPLLWRAKGKTWSILEDKEDLGKDAANLPLGVVDFSRYEQFEIALEQGDLVLCYTDSLIEAAGENGEQILPAGLLRLIQALGEPDAITLVPRLLAAITALRPGNLEGDDVTVLLFRPNGAEERISPRNTLLAPVRVARGILDSLRTGGAIPMPELSVVNLGGTLIPGLNRLWRKRKL